MTDSLTPDSFRDHLETVVPEVESGAAFLVGLSGGVDSLALLHLLRFVTPGPGRVFAAHLDHAMRPESASDARWVTGLCHAWGVPLMEERCPVPPKSEHEARLARYDLFDRARAGSGADFTATGHHADDQAETVLFRAVRGAGIEGLTGIRPRREDGVVRPLLPWSRAEVLGYARRAGLQWREDASNESTTFARNVLRHSVMPVLEAEVSPGVRSALARLAETAAGEREAWDAVLPMVLERLGVERGDSSVFVELPGLVLHPPALRARILRSLAMESGIVLDHDTTRRASDFVTNGRSGSYIELGGGLSLGRELDRLVLARGARYGVQADGSVAESRSAGNQRLEIPSAVRGSGEAVLAGQSVRVEWAAHTAALTGGPVSEVEQARFALSELDFPLRVRARSDGDRIGLPGGTRPLKKVLMEARIPASARDSVPLLVDASDRILWVPGVARSRDVSSGGRALTVRIGRG